MDRNRFRIEETEEALAFLASDPDCASSREIRQRFASCRFGEHLGAMGVFRSSPPRHIRFPDAQNAPQIRLADQGLRPLPPRIHLAEEMGSRVGGGEILLAGLSSPEGLGDLGWSFRRAGNFGNDVAQNADRATIAGCRNDLPWSGRVLLA